ncbi:F0F1 ATP synthase subunit B [Buchnera aphidicola]|uniref:F0F1 ATP synthase subunit B n=1 Tax=Buchnera aphidicola TaxID=9 RepID=UPI003BEED3C4
MNLNATIFGQVISFILFVWFCMKYIWPPIILAIETRQKEINESLLCAKKAQEELQVIKNQISKEIIEAKEKAAIIMNEAHKQKVLIIENAKNMAIKESNKILIKTKSEIQMQIIDARKKLHKETVDLGLLIAEKIIKQKIKNKETLNLTDMLISSLSKVKN